MASLVDYLVSQKQDSSYASRAKLATQYGIKGYTGTAAQNTQLLGLLQKPTTYGPTAPAPKTSLLSGSTGTGTGNVVQSTPTVSIGAKTATPSTSNLFSVSRPEASTYTTNSPGFQVPKDMGSLGGSTSYANQSMIDNTPYKLNNSNVVTPTVSNPMTNQNNINSFISNSNAPITAPVIPPAIPTDMLARTQSPTVPTFRESPAPLPSFSEFMNGGNKMTAPTADTNPYEKEYDAIGNEILTGMDKLGTKSARKLELENQAGLSGYKQQLNDINGQLAALSAEATGKQLDSQGKAIANTFINRQVDAIEREKTVKALALNAIASTLQGNISLATDTVQKALDAEFQPITDRIEYLKVALQMNESKMTRVEKKQALEQTAKLKEYEMAVEAQKEERQNIYDVMLEAAKNGASSETLNAIRSAKTAEEALSYAGSSLKSSVGGLTPATIQGTINSIVNQFDGEPTVKNYQTVAEGYQFVQTLSNKKTPTSTDDQGLIYAFAKAMDPNSVVREGEYTTVQKYSQSMIEKGWADAKRMTSNQAFLTPEARANMINTIKSKYDVSAQSYQNIYNSYQQRIEDAKSGQITGSITDYSQGYNSQPSSNSNDPLGLLGFKNASGQALNGSLSQKFESGGDPGAIGYDSTGGYSYGKAQLAHSNAKTFVEQSPYSRYFQGLTFNSPEWRNRWKQVAQADPQGFGAAQDAYIAKTHLDPQLSLLSSKGLSVDRLSPTLKEVIYSTAVQHGPKTPIVANALAKLGSNASEQALIRQIYIDRWNNGRNFASSTPAVQKAVYNRFFGPNGELATALKMSQNYA